MSHVIRRCLHHDPGHAQAGQVIGHAQQGAGHRGAGLHLLQPLPRMVLAGTRTQHISSALPISSAATRSMIRSSSCVLISTLPPPAVGSGHCPQESWAQLEKSNPRARSNTERPVNRLPAPGLETISKIKQSSASADSDHPQFSARNGHPARDIRGLGDRWLGPSDLGRCRSEPLWRARE
jgi:hypothetical protein